MLEPPKGKTPDDWEPRPQTLFRATQFGDDVDRPLRKSDGSNTYFANDIAYHADKVSRGFDVLIDVSGADHGGYVKRMQAAVKALSTNAACTLEVVLCQIVHIMRGGEPVRMSKRAGTYVTLRDLLEEVGKDAVRFTMLTRKADAQMEFDLDQAVAQTRDNPVFYVQYAHARCRSVLRAAAEMFGAADVTDAAPGRQPAGQPGRRGGTGPDPPPRAWPRTVEAAAQAREPHRIAFFLYDLAADFHMLWNRGKDDATLRFLQADRPAETLARLALVAATAVVIRSGLAVMGVSPSRKCADRQAGEPAAASAEVPVSDDLSIPSPTYRVPRQRRGMDPVTRNARTDRLRPRRRPARGASAAGRFSAIAAPRCRWCRRRMARSG